MDTILQTEGFTVVSTDESFFFYDSLVRKVWIVKDERPIVRITGSHQESVLFGATSLEGKQQIFRQYNWFDENTFLDYLKQLHRKFPKCFLFLDKAKQHYKSKKDYNILLTINIFDSCIPTNCISRIYGAGRNMSYSQK